MDGDWYCKIAGREVGPLSLRELQAMVAKGELLPTDRVRHGPFGLWRPAGQVTRLFPAGNELQRMEESAGTAAAAKYPRPVELVDVVPSPPQVAPPAGVVAFEGAQAVDVGLASLGPTVQSHDKDPLLLAYARRRQRQLQRLAMVLAVVASSLALAALLLIVSRGGEGAGDRKEPAWQGGAAPRSNDAVGRGLAETAPKPPPPVIVKDQSKVQVGKAADKPAEDGQGGQAGKSAGSQPKATNRPQPKRLQAPPGTPEGDFGIRPDDQLSETPQPTSVRDSP